jgi:hypothetical protein
MNRLPLPLLGLLAVGLVACGGNDPAVAPASPLLGAPRTSLVQPGASVPVNPGTPSRPSDIYTGPAAETRREQAAVAAACRREADRIIAFRDRGQLMREDERDARLGSDSGPYPLLSMDTRRLSRLYERDRIAEECVRQNTASPPQQQPQPQPQQSRR